MRIAASVFLFPVTEPTTHTNSAVLKGLYSFVEIHSVEEDDLEPGEIDAIKTDVHSPFVGCGEDDGTDGYHGTCTSNVLRARC